MARASFWDLCGRPLGPADYLAIATHFHTLVLDGIPRLGPENFDKARRFITLVEPLMLVVMGIVIAGLLLALYMPLFNMGGLQ